MRNTQFRDVTAEELEATWAHADNTPRVDAPRTRSTRAHDKQPNIVNHSKRYRAARKAKLAARKQATQCM
jgi:hypothetical protein